MVRLPTLITGTREPGFPILALLEYNFYEEGFEEFSPNTKVLAHFCINVPSAGFCGKAKRVYSS